MFQDLLLHNETDFLSRKVSHDILPQVVVIIFVVVIAIGNLKNDPPLHGPCV